MQSVIPQKLEVERPNTPSDEDRKAMFGSDAGQMDKPMHMARLLSWALADLMLAYKEIAVMGEDVGPKGGVYNVTAKLHQRFGSARVVNTLLDEQAIRSEEHTSELQSLMRISYAAFCLKKKK